MSELNWTEIRQEIDNCIKSGQIDRARRDLNAINIAKVPKSEKIYLANLCRRTGLLNLGLKFLSRIIRDDIEGIETAHSNEKAEYGVLLQRIGAVDEAKKTLSQIDSSQTPVAELYLAFCHFNQWNYRAAIEPLNRYLGLIDPDSYAYTVGQVNLAAALVNVRSFDEADHLLEELIKKTTKKGMKLLRSNCFEIKSQLEIQRSNFKGALDLLDKSEMELSSHQVMENFFIYKWKSIAKASLRGKSYDWSDLRSRAYQINHPESIREIDYYESTITDDRKLGLKVLFGTPYPEYRSNLLSKMNLEVPEFYRWSSENVSNQAEFDLLMGSSFDKRFQFKIGSSLHRLLCILIKDFYRPKALGALFSHMYSGEYFDPHSSPDRVHQVLRRLRASFNSQGDPLSLEKTNKGYLIKRNKNIAVWVPKDYPELTRDSLIAHQLRRVFGNNRFSRKEFQQEFNYEYTAANRWLNDLLEQGVLTRDGSGRGTKYFLNVA